LEGLLDFMAAHGLEEFEYEHGGFHIRLRKASAGSHNASRGNSAQEMTSAPPAAPTSPAGPDTAGGSTSSAVAAAPAADDLHVIKSPIVGTFYGSPTPGAAPFVNVGDAIPVGQVVCIIEAMKLMNEIEADVNGEVVRVLAENGQPVEYGQPLFAIRPMKK
jgi:acetyl-CoA carboxylase biotin carboxyl carrier protein